MPTFLSFLLPFSWVVPSEFRFGLLFLTFLRDMGSWERDRLDFLSFFGDTVVGCELPFLISHSEYLLSLPDLSFSSGTTLRNLELHSIFSQHWKLQMDGMEGGREGSYWGYQPQGGLYSFTLSYTASCFPLRPCYSLSRNLPSSDFFYCRSFSLIILILRLLVSVRRRGGIEGGDLPVILHTRTPEKLIKFLRDSFMSLGLFIKLYWKRFKFQES